jgi:hypothetical protein
MHHTVVYYETEQGTEVFDYSSCFFDPKNYEEHCALWDDFVVKTPYFVLLHEREGAN